MTWQQDVYERYKKYNTSRITQLMIDNLSEIYENGDVESLLYCWDPITISALLTPSLITRSETRDIIMVETDGYTYGSSFSWPEGCGPEDASTVTMVLDVDRDAFWDFLVKLYALPD